jgi:hypothetical protein
MSGFRGRNPEAATERAVSRTGPDRGRFQGWPLVLRWRGPGALLAVRLAELADELAQLGVPVVEEPLHVVGDLDLLLADEPGLEQPLDRPGGRRALPVDRRGALRRRWFDRSGAPSPGIPDPGPG